MTSLLAALALGSVGLQSAPAQTPLLGPDELKAKLDTIAVFTLADEEAKPLTAPSEDGKSRQFGVYLSHKDAEAALADLKASSPEIASKIKLTITSLSQAYTVEEQSLESATPLKMALVPDSVEVEAAKEQYKRQGQDPKLLKGVPVFVPKLKDGNKYLTLSVNDKPAFPFFLSMADLRALLDRFKQANPAASASLIVEITSLETVIQTLRVSNEPSMAQFAFIQSSQTRTYIKSLTEKDN